MKRHLTPIMIALLASSPLPAAAQMYAVDFVSTAANATVMDPTGRVIAGTVSLAPTCATCPPTFGVPAIWAGGQRFLLTVPAGRDYLSFANANSSGWIAGTATNLAGTLSTAMVWKPQAGFTGFDAVELGTLPGLASSRVAGIDESRRVVGLSFTWQVAADPFLWDTVGGIRSLTAAGAVADEPLAISPGGTVATSGYTYLLSNPAAAVAVNPAPSGFNGLTQFPVAVNDAGERATFLLTTQSDPLRYPFRYKADGSWQLLSGAPTGNLSTFGVGSIGADSTITGTAQSTGFLAAGPAGTAFSLQSMISPAYAGAGVSSAGDRAADGSILASTSIGRSYRLTKLVPVAPCTTNCLRVSSLTMTGKMVSERGHFGQCTAKAYNRIGATLNVVDENGAPVAGATIRGRVLDDYYLDQAVTLRTSRQGIASLKTQTAACVGAVAFLVDSVASPGSSLDRTQGVLTNYVIPQP